MKCPQCGQTVEPSATFCGNCGQQLQQTADAQSQFQQQQPNTFQSVPVAPAVQTSVTSVSPGSSSVSGQSMTSGEQMNPPVAPAQQMPMAPQSMGGHNVPAYAMGQNHPAAGSGLLTWAVVLACLSIPGALIPIVGLAFGITAIVLAAKHHHAGTGRMVTAIVIGSIGVLLALAAWGYNVSQHLKRTAFVQPTTGVATMATIQASPALYETLFTANH